MYKQTLMYKCVEQFQQCLQCTLQKSYVFPSIKKLHDGHTLYAACHLLHGKLSNPLVA